MKKYLLSILMLTAGKWAFSQVQGTVPILSSDLGSASVLYIDFNGHYVTGTPWNWNGAINAQPSGLSTTQMKDIFKSVAADYSVFKVNVTTDPLKYNAAPAASRMRIIVTTTSSWYGSAGGVAYIGSFTWGDDTPCWVFSSLLKYDSKKVGEAIAHEAGHTLGLQHQSKYDANCNKLAEYNPGTGSFTSGWSPIMGVSYGTNCTTWMKGKTTVSCNSIQDDIAVIAGYPNNLFIRADEAGNSYSNAKTLPLTPTITGKGLITTMTDKDVYAMNITTTSRLRLSVIPEAVGTGDRGANLNVKLSLLNKVGSLIKSYNPSTLTASIDTTLRPATYYLVVEGIGTSYIPDYGSIGRYTITGTTATATLTNTVTLIGNSTGTMHNLQWSVPQDIQVMDVEVLESTDGKHFIPVQHLQPGTSTFDNYAPQASLLYYQVKVTDAIMDQHYSSVVALPTDIAGGNRVVPNASSRTLQVQSGLAGQYEILNASGQLIQRGIVQAGNNTVQVNGTAKGFLVFKLITTAGSQPFKFIFP